MLLVLGFLLEKEKHITAMNRHDHNRALGPVCLSLLCYSDV